MKHNLRQRPVKTISVSGLRAVQSEGVTRRFVNHRRLRYFADYANKSPMRLANLKSRRTSPTGLSGSLALATKLAGNGPQLLNVGLNS